jgi:hypothetical protein
MIYVPVKRLGQWCFDEAPIRVGVSPISQEARRNRHFSSMTKYHREWVLEWLDELRSYLGEQEIVQVPRGYKLQRTPVGGETWADKEKGLVVRPTAEGVANSKAERLRIYGVYMLRAAKVLPVEHFYFAGNPQTTYPIEYWLGGNRLLSYAFMDPTGNRACLERHLGSVERSQKASLLRYSTIGHWICRPQPPFLTLEDCISLQDCI